MTEPTATHAYLTAKLDQFTAASRDRDPDAADQVIADIIRDDQPAARQAIADALRLYAARQNQADNA